MRVFVLRKQDVEGLTEELETIHQAAQEEVKQKLAEELNRIKDSISEQLNALEIDPNNFDNAKEVLQEIINSLGNLLGSMEDLEEQIGQSLRKHGTISLITDSDIDLVDKFMLVVANIVKNYPPTDKETADAAKAAINEMREILDRMEESVAVITMPSEE